VQNGCGFFVNACGGSSGCEAKITITIDKTTASNNGLAGFEPDEVSSDDGDDFVNVTITNTVTNDNGANGVEINTLSGTGADGHSLSVIMEKVTANGNDSNGIAVLGDANSGFTVGFDEVTASQNDDSGILVTSVSVTARLPKPRSSM